MSDLVSRTTLKTNIRNTCKLDTPFTSDAFLNAEINKQTAAFYDLMISVDPDYYITTDYVHTTSGTRSYDLPSDFYLLRGVAIKDGTQTDGYSILSRFEWDERYDFDANTYPDDIRYRIVGSNLELQPTPESTETIELSYIPKPTLFSDDSDTFDFINQYNEWVEIGVCLKGLDRDIRPQTFQQLALQKQMVEERIKEMGRRDDNEPPTVTDVFRASRSRRGFFR